ncbi:exoskeleton protein RP43-like [Hyperolius riggenbachi]|uniref:exoskeleton protein RP43-like n=1 Tax=Hyperolius riggenbachi TaxID=752182 RepID=UPI0035A32FCA
MINLLGSTGSFSSADVITANSKDNCLRLLQTPGNQILLKFSQFVCLTKYCSDKINIYDGVNKNAALLATVYADQPLPVLLSSSSFLLLEYITAAPGQSSFSGSYSSDPCKTKLLGPSGSFSSADAYATNSKDNCWWLLQTPGNQILLKFSQFVCQINNCNDKINIYDGVNKNATLLATVYANQPLPVLVSSSSFLLLEYITAAPGQSSFSGSYSSDPCKTKLLGSSGSFSSANVIATNSKDNCWWLLQTPGNKILLKFNQFVCVTKNCSDKINIYDGVNKNAALLATVYANQPFPVLVSSSSFLFVEYITAAAGQSTFDGSYTTVKYGGTYTSSFSYIVVTSTDDGIPVFYTIIAPPGYKSAQLSGAGCELTGIHEHVPMSGFNLLPVTSQEAGSQMVVRVHGYR